MRSLGIVPGHHDPSACLVVDGSVVAFVEEERIIREKHAVGKFPVRSVEECLDIADLTIEEIDKIGLSRNYDEIKKGFPKL